MDILKIVLTSILILPASYLTALFLCIEANKEGVEEEDKDKKKKFNICRY